MASTSLHAAQRLTISRSTLTYLSTTLRRALSSPPQDLPGISPGSPLTSPGFPISPEVSRVSLCREPHEIAHEIAHEITSSIWSASRTVRAAEQIRRRPIRKQVSRVRLRPDQPRRHPTRPAQIRDESGGGGGGGAKGSPNWLNPPGGGGGGEANDSPKPAPKDGADAKPNVGSGGGGGGGSLKLNISLGAAAAPPAPGGIARIILA